MIKAYDYVRFSNGGEAYLNRCDVVGTKLSITLYTDGRSKHITEEQVLENRIVKIKSVPVIHDDEFTIVLSTWTFMKRVLIEEYVQTVLTFANGKTCALLAFRNGVSRESVGETLWSEGEIDVLSKSTSY